MPKPRHLPKTKTPDRFMLPEMSAFSACRDGVISALKGRDISARGKRGAAPGSEENESQALKGRNSPPGIQRHNEGQCLPEGTACIALSGRLSINNETQGGAWRLTPPRLPWADMLRPFRAEQGAVLPYNPRRSLPTCSLITGEIVPWHSACAVVTPAAES